ncbi:MAG: 30S ribosomal protein S3 [Deltaproteobacteria bacterium]|nr:30S ribosomal protein S3 [Deltaproteobacteria bacterium]
MGQKTHPIGFRLGVIRTWNSKWYEDKAFAQWLHEDLRVKRYIKNGFRPQGMDQALGKSAGISKIEIERAANKCKVNIFTARPGIVIGKRGAGVDQLKRELQRFTQSEIFVNIHEVRRAETDAQLVAESVATQLERRVTFRRAMKKAVASAIKSGAKGIKIMCAGRLGGAEMARCEWYREGRVPLHTLRADIDYGFAEGNTTYGQIGVKTWVFRGEVQGQGPSPSPR